MQILASCGEPVLCDHGYKGVCRPTQDQGSLLFDICMSNTAGALTGLERLADVSIPALRTLGLHNLCIAPRQAPRLYNVMSCLAGTLEELTLDLCVVNAACMPDMHDGAQEWCFSGRARMRIFESVAQLERLKRFTLPEWVPFVGPDTSCVAPLERLAELKTVHVCMIPQHLEAEWNWRFELLETSQ